MTLTDNNLISLLSTLSPGQRRSVEAHLRGRVTDESWAVLRWIKRKLKRRVRAKRK